MFVCVGGWARSCVCVRVRICVCLCETLCISCFHSPAATPGGRCGSWCTIAVSKYTHEQQLCQMQHFMLISMHSLLSVSLSMSECFNRVDLVNRASSKACRLSWFRLKNRSNINSGRITFDLFQQIELPAKLLRDYFLCSHKRNIYQISTSHIEYKWYCVQTMAKTVPLFLPCTCAFSCRRCEVSRQPRSEQDH